MGLVAATTTTATTGFAIIVIDQQQNDDDEQNPGAVVAAEQVTQAHVFHPLTLPYYVTVREVVNEILRMYKGTKTRLYSIQRRRGYVSV